MIWGLTKVMQWISPETHCSFDYDHPAVATARPECSVFVGDSSAEDLRREIAACLKAKRAGFDYPVARQRLDARGEVFAAAFTGDDEIAESRIWPLKHEIILA